MKKEDFILMLRDVLNDFYRVYRTIGVDSGFRSFFQYIIDKATRIEDDRQKEARP